MTKIKMEGGRIYRRRDGNLTGVISAQCDHTFRDFINNISYSENGRSHRLKELRDDDIVDEFETNKYKVGDYVKILDSRSVCNFNDGFHVKVVGKFVFNDEYVYDCMSNGVIESVLERYLE